MPDNDPTGYGTWCAYTMSPHRTGPTPFLEAPRDRALWAVAHGRTREIDLSHLTPGDLVDMRRMLVDDRNRARRQHLFDHLVGGSITAAFVLVGFALMVPGPWLAGGGCRVPSSRS